MTQMILEAARVLALEAINGLAEDQDLGQLIIVEQGIIETAVGAATWPSGDQLWNGKIPASTAKPMKMNGNHSLAKVSASMPR